MSRSPFTEPLIRACKRQLSGESVDLAVVVGQVAACSSKHIVDSDVRGHLAEAMLELAQVPESVARYRLHDVLWKALALPDRFREAIAMLGITRVDDLRKIGLWSDIEAPITSAPILPSTTATEPNTCP